MKRNEGRGKKGNKKVTGGRQGSRLVQSDQSKAASRDEKQLGAKKEQQAHSGGRGIDCSWGRTARLACSSSSTSVGTCSMDQDEEKRST